MEVSFTFSPGEYSKRMTLSGTFQLITEMNTPPFLWCTRLMFSAPQCPVLPAGCSQRNTPDWTPGVKFDLCMMVVECLPWKFFFQTQLQGQDQALVPLFTYVI
ncbi:hypothetical protein TNCV_3379901 [Trichonephila clavipes]|nr:hypothetical protein TNCV_3379901 [Trichonephila clavipes]